MFDTISERKGKWGMPEMRILLLFNTVSFEEKAEDFTLGECASNATVGAVYDALTLTGGEVIPLNLFSPEQLIETVSANHFDVAFVIAEGFLDLPHTLYDGSGAMLIREILNKQGIPSTHSSPDAMSLCRNKDATYHMLSAFNVNVPSFAVIRDTAPGSLAQKVAELEENVPYPLFVKPVGGGSSICIDRHSVVKDRKELTERIQMVQAVLGSQPVLVETYLPGREYTIGVLGNGEKFVLPVIGFAPDAGVRSAADKGAFSQVNTQVEFIPDNDPLGLSLMSMAEKTFDVLGVRDIIRVDVKEDAQGVCHVIDVNGTPSLAPSASVIKMAGAMGIGHQEVVALILYAALTREKIELPLRLADIITDPLAKLRAIRPGMVA